MGSLLYHENFLPQCKKCLEQLPFWRWTFFFFICSLRSISSRSQGVRVLSSLRKRGLCLLVLLLSLGKILPSQNSSSKIKLGILFCRKIWPSKPAKTGSKPSSQWGGTPNCQGGCGVILWLSGLKESLPAKTDSSSCCHSAAFFLVQSLLLYQKRSLAHSGSKDF